MIGLQIPMTEKACKGIDTPPTSVERYGNVITYGSDYVMNQPLPLQAGGNDEFDCSPDRRQLRARNARCRDGGYAVPNV